MKNTERHLIDNSWLIGKEYKIQQKEKEWKGFLETLLTADVTVGLEIGSYDGGTTVSLAQIVDKLITVEFTKARYNTADISKYCDFTFIQGDSTNQSTIDKVKGVVSEVDFIFIDGCHDYEAVKKDFYNYSPLVKSGGIVAFHDTLGIEYAPNEPAYVYKLWKEIKNNYKYIEFVNEPLDWGGIGVLWMP